MTKRIKNICLDATVQQHSNQINKCSQISTASSLTSESSNHSHVTYNDNNYHSHRYHGVFMLVVIKNEPINLYMNITYDIFS